MSHGEVGRAHQALTERLARASARHRWRVLIVWGLLALGAAAFAATSLHGLVSTGTTPGKTESKRAADAIAQAFPQTRTQDNEVVIVRSDRLTAAAPSFRAEVARLVGQLRASGKAQNVTSYLSGVRGMVSRDRHAALIGLFVASDSANKPIGKIVKRAGRSDEFAVSMTGEHTINNDFSSLSESDLAKGELGFGLPAAFVVLMLVFGALVAGLVPIVMALLSIMVDLDLVTLVTLQFDLSVFVVNMLTGMGLALGIDYSLFVISRYREERARDVGKRSAIAVTGATASSAVLISGGTFVVAMLALLTVRSSVMRSLAVGAIIIALVSVAAALTLLPAVLDLIGDRVNALRIPYIGRYLATGGAAESRAWGRIISRVLRRPALSLLITASVMIAAATPVLSLHIGASSVSTLPNSTLSKQGYLALQQSFPEANPQPVQIVIKGPAARDNTMLASIQTKLGHDPRFARGQLQVNPAQEVAWLSVPPHGDPIGSGAIAAVRDLRRQILPATVPDPRSQAWVGGWTALNIEYFDAINTATPVVLGLVFGLSFVLLTIAFQSIVVAGVSILLNLLSVGAAYGLLTLVFLHGIGATLFGFQHVDTIDAWIPLFLFAVLFGLSMDYQVLLLSRIKERAAAGSSTRDAASAGITTTARIITGAALIMIAVFIGFVLGQLVQFQELGLGIGIALLLDATLIRLIVLPCTLTLLGDRSWYLPNWLRWLPHPAETPPRPPSHTQHHAA